MKRADAHDGAVLRRAAGAATADAPGGTDDAR